MELLLKRRPTADETTFGQLFIDGVVECHTLEDAIREVEGEPVALWKIHGKTAIPSGRYRVTLENSTRFGPDTITLNAVPGFTSIRVHTGNTAEDTEGCIIVGDQIYRSPGPGTYSMARITGGTVHGVLKRLKEKVRGAISTGAVVWIVIENPQADVIIDRRMQWTSSNSP